ncbi:MAG: LamG domain-containing protein [Armatimonadetes bacterium]|nr:LamG domain-containing protein [Armatimonadota bacterium]
MRSRFHLLWVVAALAASAAHAAGPIAVYHFDEAGGRQASDSVGAAHGTLQGDAAFAPEGVSGNCLHLTRAGGGLVHFGDRFAFEQGDYSIVVWVKTAVPLTDADTFIVSRHQAGWENGYFLFLHTTAWYGRAERASFYASDQIISTSAVTDGRWHQVAAVYRANGTSELYVDGAPAQASAKIRPMVPNKAPFVVGGVTWGDAPRGSLTGWVDELRLYSGALTADEVQALFRQPSGVGGPTVDTKPGARQEMVITFADGRTQTIRLSAPAETIASITFR